MRIPQNEGEKGSLKWIQQHVAESGGVLDAVLRAELSLSPESRIEWKSPQRDDDFAEYRDADFLKLLGLERLEPALTSFWPQRGPQWDALGVTSDGKVILVEAKAHPAELTSACAAEGHSREMIERAFARTKERLGVPDHHDWTSAYYQYANRLAHLQFLREHAVDAHLVFVYFLNDREMRGPSTALAWGDKLDECYSALGLAPEVAIPGLHSVFVDLQTPDMAAERSVRPA